ncbi:MAG TPA: DUF3618 domain-containing protein [Friedmanniella sp.]
MSDSTPAADEKQTPEQIQAHIEATRDRLAANVDALSDKLDVKAHAADAVHDAGAKVQDAVADARESVASAAGAAAAQSRTLVEKFRALPLAAQAAIGAGAAALVVTLIVRSARS